MIMRQTDCGNGKWMELAQSMTDFRICGAEDLFWCQWVHCRRRHNNVHKSPLRLDPFSRKLSSSSVQFCCLFLSSRSPGGKRKENWTVNRRHAMKRARWNSTHSYPRFQGRFVFGTHSVGQFGPRIWFWHFVRNRFSESRHSASFILSEEETGRHFIYCSVRS
jgi:hypothetical protein